MRCACLPALPCPAVSTRAESSKLGGKWDPRAVQTRNAAVSSSIQRDLQRFVLYPDAYLRAGVLSPSSSSASGAAGVSATAATMGAASLGGGGVSRAGGGGDERKAASLVGPRDRPARSVTPSAGAGAQGGYLKGVLRCSACFVLPCLAREWRACVCCAAALSSHTVGPLFLAFFIHPFVR